MSLATFKKKTQAKYHNNSVNEVQFSTVGAYRNQGRVGQSNQSRFLTGPNSNGTTLCSKNDNTVVKKASMNTNGMLLSRYRWLRRPYDATQPFDSISVKPGAGNILYGSQDAYIERKRKEAMCCDNGSASTSTSTSALTTIVSRIIDTPLLDVFKSALGQESLSDGTVDSNLNAAGYGIATGSGADYNQMGGDYLSDPTIALIKDLRAKLSVAGTPISDTEKVRSHNSITLSGATDIDSKTHTITSTNVELMKHATTFNTTKNIVLSTGTTFLATIIGIKQAAQAAQMAAIDVVAHGIAVNDTPNFATVRATAIATGVVSGTSVGEQSVTAVDILARAVLRNNPPVKSTQDTYALPNLYGIADANIAAIEQVGVLSWIVSQTKDADGIPTQLTDAQLRVLTLVIYSIDRTLGIVSFNTDNSATSIVDGYYRALRGESPQLLIDSQLGSSYFPSANVDRGNWSGRQKSAMTKFYELQAKIQLIRSYQRFINFPATINFTGGASGYINLINDFRNGLSNNADYLTTLITLFFTIYNARTSITVNGTPLSTPMSYAELYLLSEYLAPLMSQYTSLTYEIGKTKDIQAPEGGVTEATLNDVVSTFIRILDLYHNPTYSPDRDTNDSNFIFGFSVAGEYTYSNSFMREYLPTEINEYIVMNYSITISEFVYETIILNQSYPNENILDNFRGSLTRFSSNWKNLYTATQNIVDDVNKMSEKPESIISLGDIVSIGDQYFIITGINEDLTAKNLTTKTDALQTIPLGTNVNLITLSDDDGNRTTQTSVTTTTTKSKDCCLLDIDKAFLDQNNQQKRCGSTNTCG